MCDCPRWKRIGDSVVVCLCGGALLGSHIAGWPFGALVGGAVGALIGYWSERERE
jgi:Glycine zipper